MRHKEKAKQSAVYCLSERADCDRVQQRIHALELSEARYQGLFVAVADALVSIGPDGLINRVNSACEQVFGWPVDALPGMSLATLFPDCSQVELAYRKALSGVGQVLELPFVWPNGQRVTLALQLSTILAGPEISGVLLTGHDLTKEKACEQERAQLYADLQSSHRELEKKALAFEDSRQQLRQAMSRQEKTNEELRKIGRMKTDFIGIASHELRTPLTFLLGALEYLGESLPGRINEDEQSLLDYALQGSERLSDIVENMLDIIRLEADGFHPQRETIALLPLLTHIQSNLAGVLKERELTLVWPGGEQWPELSVDPSMVRRALEDVIGNAIKYTEPGGEIRLSGVFRSRESLVADAAHIKRFWSDFSADDSCSDAFFDVCVTDNGIGIPRQELPHVFERFYTVGKLDEHSSGDKFLGRGAGLGLALVKRIMHGHNGLSWAVSPGSREETALENPGSCFHLLFPITQNPAPVELPVAGDRKARILVIDDEPAIRRLIEILLSKKYDLELAVNGVDGLVKARTFSPDLILLDLFMPEMDGFEVCEKLKLDPQTADIPVAMFTAMARKHERDRGRDVGAVAYIAKPFLPRELMQRIDLLLQEYCRDENTLC